MRALSAWVVRHRGIVGLLWLGVTVVGLVIAPSVSGRLKSGVNVHSTAYNANQQIARHYGGAASPPGLIIVHLPPGQTVTSPAVKSELAALDARIAHAQPTLREVSYASTGSHTLVGAGGTSTLLLVYPAHPGDDVSGPVLDQLSAVAKSTVPGSIVHATGEKALAAGNTSSGHSSVLVELLIGALGAVLVLAWVFGSFLALLPLVMALISVLTMQLIIYGLTFIVPSSTPFNPAVQYIVALLGLGLSIDYSLLIVNRWREERAAGRSNSDAVDAAVQRAGHAVMFSGITASLGLFALVVVPVSLVRGIGIAGLFIPSTATLVALSLLPAVLSKIGPRIDWPRRRSSGRVSRFWTAWARGVIKHRVLAAVLGLGILCGLAAVATTINIAQPAGPALASNGPYAAGLRSLQADGFGSGALTTVPIYVPSAHQAPSVVATLNNVASVRGAMSPAGPAWHSGGSAMVLAIPTNEVGTTHGGTSLSDIRHSVPTAVLGRRSAGGDFAAFLGRHISWLRSPRGRQVDLAVESPEPCLGVGINQRLMSARVIGWAHAERVATRQRHSAQRARVDLGDLIVSHRSV
jgi:RND superfamily putative drug exporter